MVLFYYANYWKTDIFETFMSVYIYTHTTHTHTHIRLSCSPPSRVPWELQPLHQEHCKCYWHPASSTVQEVPITSQRAGEKSQLRREGILRVMEDDHAPQQTGDHCSDPLSGSEDTKNRSCPEHHHETCRTHAEPDATISELCWLTPAKIAKGRTSKQMWQARFRVRSRTCNADTTQLCILKRRGCLSSLSRAPCLPQPLPNS